MKEVLFLVDNFFFKNISPQYFEKKFLNHFIYEEKYINEFIVRESEPAEFIYFIKKGITTRTTLRRKNSPVE